MYSNLPNLMIGFHGCDLATYENVLYKHERLRASHNSYDWLGNGIYFWENNLRPYDSVRGVFIEGNPVYDNSEIMEKTHTQLCIINPNCIKGYFNPLTPDNKWSMI